MPTFVSALLTASHWAVWLIGGAALVATLMPLLRHTAWWIRVFDFPRLQIVLALVLVAAASLALGHAGAGRGQQLFLLALAAATVYQLLRIIPYTRLVPKDVADSTRTHDPRAELSLVVMNVLQYNREGALALATVRAADPDVIMAVETDAWWYEQLQPLEETHPYTCHEPLDNTYGLLFFSRLPLKGCQIKYLLDDDIPSLHTHVQLPDGRTWVRLYGLHPKPPAPQESKTSTKRDAELLLVGKEVDRRDEATIVFGDMNDVAWSHTSELFRRVSGLLDPRVGRGLMPTFHADYRLLRWPLDHVFVSAHFQVVDMRRLPHVGSDHFPIFVRLSYEPQHKAEQEENAEQADAEDRAEADEKIAEGFAEEQEDEAETDAIKA
ncbi:endonuclease/exonuclease/phosphatase family protein [Hymenobacter armeniacus]|uniref:Endonuclease/exonuclease/phosphatase family protein n=1 Tax=Hymenobacter armeniacus TaxID=2771358 RepID=A0ABR8JRB1_9BACT|nr:endonuclease/exonuclease/phosphatase family protein [Hymenobacter armeniacus]MBD2722494.1 endonuclease/exonuclease/phosphatase family protein [Hymenobacter armeniacus]